MGCTPLALAQLLAYYAWPLRGEGSTAYWWAGDVLCGGSSPGDTIRADFLDPYEWDKMQASVDYLSAQESRQAVAKLCFEAAAACRTDFSYCGSSASLSAARAALITYFRYRSTSQELIRFHYSNAVWFAKIRNEIDAGRPILYSSTIHTMVCDGWREVAGLPQVHINYGWAGDSDDWYGLDDIETSLNPGAEHMLVGVMPVSDPPLEVTSLHVSRLDLGAEVSWRVSGVLDAARIPRVAGDVGRDAGAAHLEAPHRPLAVLLGRRDAP